MLVNPKVEWHNFFVDINNVFRVYYYNPEYFFFYTRVEPVRQRFFLFMLFDVTSMPRGKAKTLLRHPNSQLSLNRHRSIRTNAPLNAREKVRLPWGQECSVTSEDVAGQFICVGLMKLKETGVGWFRFQRRWLYCGGVFKHLLFFLSFQKVTGWNPISLKQHFFISFCCVFNPRWWKCCCPTDWILALCSRMAVRGQGPLSEGERAQSRQVSYVKSARNLSPSLL